MRFNEGGASASSSTMIVKPSLSINSVFYHEQELSFWLKGILSSETIVIDLMENPHINDDNVSSWLSNATLSLPFKPIATFVPMPYCMSAVNGQNGPPRLELPKHDESSSSTALSGTSNDVGNQKPTSFLNENEYVGEKVCFHLVNQEPTIFLKKENDNAEIRNLSLKEAEPETEKTVSCFSAMIARSLRSIRKKLLRARRSERQTSS